MPLNQHVGDLQCVFERHSVPIHDFQNSTPSLDSSSCRPFHAASDVSQKESPAPRGSQIPGASPECVVRFRLLRLLLVSPGNVDRSIASISGSAASSSAEQASFGPVCRGEFVSRRLRAQVDLVSGAGPTGSRCKFVLLPLGRNPNPRVVVLTFS